ncbi:hypothetical protein [Streptomyces sp. NPDC048577]|uniref:hypothetical protein n=1 Tax=Streptomyces sp. NPDC048577 TaxID=3157209 RepID=UPI00343BCF75
MVLLIPHRGETGDQAALPADYRRILAVVRAVGGPVQVKAVGKELGLEMRGPPLPSSQGSSGAMAR